MKLKTPKYEGIQALRFIAALLVVVTHSTFYASERLSGSGEVWSRGAMGVDIFFVISGFVMVIASQRGDGWVTWHDFVYRRAIRIFPPYWAATTLNVLVLLALPAMVLHSSLDADSIIKSYFLVPDYNLDGATEPLLGVGWTLYFETFFYAAFALALALRLNPVWWVSAFMVIVTAVSLFRSDTWPPTAVYLNPLVLEFVAGMFIGRFAPLLRAPLWGAVAVFVIGFAVLLFAPAGTGIHRAAMFGIPSAAIVAGVVMLEPYVQGRRWIGPLVFLGGASYVLYLFHPLVAPVAPVVLSRLGINSMTLSVAMSMTGAVVFAALVYQFFERPFLERVKRPFWINRGASAPAR